MATKNAVGNSLTGVTGTGTFVGATSPTLVTPALGTPSSGTLTNCTGLKSSGVLFSGISVARSGNQSIPNTTFTKVQFDTEVYDTQNTFDSTTNYRWTPNVAGKYFVYASLYFSSMGDGKLCYCSIYKNGSNISSNLFHSGSATDVSSICTSIVDCNGTTDYIEVFAYQNNGGAINITSVSVMVGYLIGA